MKLSKLSIVLMISASALFTSGCGSLLNQNTATGGKKVSFQEDMKAQKAQKNKKKPVAKPQQTTVTEDEKPQDQKLGNDIENSLSTELKTGVIKPYIPEENSKNQSLLPHIDSLGPAANQANKVSMQDVLDGKVDLNNLNNKSKAQNTASDDNSESKLTPFIDGGSDDELSNAIEQSIEGLENTSKCNVVDGSHTQQLAYNIAVAQAKRISSELGPIYVAPTVIPDELHDCVVDLSKPIAQGFNDNSLRAISSGRLKISQNQGSSTLIPSLVRACRQNNVAVLNVSIIRKNGNKYMLNIRNIRVIDGITITQTSQALK